MRVIHASRIDVESPAWVWGCRRPSHRSRFFSIIVSVRRKCSTFGGVNSENIRDKGGKPDRGLGHARPHAPEVKILAPKIKSELVFCAVMVADVCGHPWPQPPGAKSRKYEVPTSHSIQFWRYFTLGSSNPQAPL